MSWLFACERGSTIPGLDAGVSASDGAPVFLPIKITELEPAPNLFAVWGTGPNDVYVVGERGYIAHYDGVSWATETTTATEDLRSVSGVVAGRSYDVWAVGMSGRVLRLHLDLEAMPPTPRRWVFESAQTNVDFSAVAAGRNRVVAVGVGGAISEWTEAAGWQAVASNTLERLNGVWVSGDGEEGVAVGNLGTIVRRSAGAWARQRVAGLVQQLNEVWGTSVDSLLIVGLDGTVLRSAGTEWETVEGAPRVNLRDVAGLNVNSAYIVGMSGVLVALTGSELAVVPDASGYRLEGVWGTMLQLDAGVDGGPAEKPLYYVVGVSGTALVGP